MAEAIESGIFNDLGSGSNVDVTVLTKGNVEVLRNYRTPNERPPKEASYKYPRGTTGKWTELVVEWWFFVIHTLLIEIRGDG